MPATSIGAKLLWCGFCAQWTAVRASQPVLSQLCSLRLSWADSNVCSCYGLFTCGESLRGAFFKAGNRGGYRVGIHESSGMTVRRSTGPAGAKPTEVWQQLQLLGQLQCRRIACKAKGRILFLDPAEVIAVEAEGNYVSLQHRARAYILRESISTLAENLKSYGFIRIHRSVLVNSSLVEEIQPWTTGEYRLRVRGGKEYTVTRTYKKNLRFLAQLWLGVELFCSK